MIDILLTYLGARSMCSLKSRESNKMASKGKLETETEREREKEREEEKKGVGRREEGRKETCQRTSQSDRIVRLLYDTANVMAPPQRRPGGNANSVEKASFHEFLQEKLHVP